MEPTGRTEIRDILARTDLAALLDELATPAAHAARGRKWHCPIAGHDDQNPSVTMYTDGRGHQRWRCWSGDDGHRGDALDLVAAVRNLSRRDAIEWLATRVGHTPEPNLPRPASVPARPAGTVPLDPAVVSYTTLCAQLLWTPHGAPVRRWLHDRGLSDDVLRVNQVGADLGRRTLPRPWGLPAGNSVAATFPAFDPAGAVAYVQARYLDPQPGQSKYDNPVARYGTNPRLAWCRPPVPRHPRQLVICEGIPDALTAAQAGYRAVGMLGTHAADTHVAQRLAEHATRDELELAAVVDADPAGRAAGARLASLLAEHQVELRVVEPPDGLDLNGWARRDPAWTNQITPNSYGPRPLDVVRDELVTALRFRIAHQTHPGMQRISRSMIEDNERDIARLEAELDELNGLRRLRTNLDDHPVGNHPARTGSVAPARRGCAIDL